MATGFLVKKLEELQNGRFPVTFAGMSSMQIGFIVFTFLGPVALWLLSRKVQSRRLAVGIDFAFAGVLLVAYVLNFAWHWKNGLLSLQKALPMQLCDWAAFATLAALLGRRAMAFELAYFWGIAGTAQALFTPAVNIAMDVPTWCFFILHSAIPAGVFWLMFEFQMRPRPGAFLRIMAWSQGYLVCALLVNRWTGANFGFLASRPEQKTMLDFFPDPHWLYVLCFEGVAVVFFLALDLPWMLRRRKRRMTNDE